MAFEGREYQLVANDDNFPAYARSLGFPADIEANLINTKPVLKIEKDGDLYTQTIETSEGVYITTFKSGVEYDKTWGELKFRSTTFVEGNTITHVNERNGRKYIIKSVFTDKDLNETLTSTNFKGVATRYFKAI